MSLRSFVELVVGGPARPFPLTVREADLLANALAEWSQAYRESDVPPEDVFDLQSDSETLANAHDLRQRLLEHAGYKRKPR